MLYRVGFYFGLGLIFFLLSFDSGVFRVSNCYRLNSFFSIEYETARLMSQTNNRRDKLIFLPIIHILLLKNN